MSLDLKFVQKDLESRIAAKQKELDARDESEYIGIAMNTGFLMGLQSAKNDIDMVLQAKAMSMSVDELLD